MEQHTADLVIRGVGKAYGAVTVLADADLTVQAGTIHALVGENGAGKSTLLGTIAGRIRPSTGVIRFEGTDLLGTPRAARDAGIASVYQELTVLPALSAMDNVFLGRPPSSAGVLRRRTARRRFRELASTVGLEVSPDVRAGSLSVAQQQQLEILRAVDSGARLVLLDEPTASLAAAERAALLDVMRGLRDRGITLVFVSHNLDEVLEVSDRITALRNGRIVETRARPAWTKSDLVGAMLGDRGGILAPALSGTGGASDEQRSPGAELLRVEDLRVPGVLDGVDLAVRAGEIVGIGGLVGSGRSTILRAVAGDRAGVRGRMVVAGRAVPWPRSVRRALRLGLALVPEERKRDGLILGLDTASNVTITDPVRVSRGGWIRRGARLAATLAATRGFELDPEVVHRPVGTLSGGNQQKVVLARWAYRPPLVLLADEPGRGIDLGAKATILRTLRDFAAEGHAVLMVSSESDELLTFADRILVVANGRISAEFDNRARTITERQILDAAFAHPKELQS